MATKERNEYREREDGTVEVWRVVEHEREGAGGAWPLGELTMQGAVNALSDLHSQAATLGAQYRDVLTRIDELEPVMARMFARERAGVVAANVVGEGAVLQPGAGSARRPK